MKYLSAHLKNIWNKFRSSSLKKKTLLLVGIVLILFIFTSIISNITKPPPYKTFTVKKDKITEYVTESGKISTNGKVDVYSPTNGIVTEVFVNNDDSVEEGQELFAVESSATEQEQQLAYANYLTASSTLGTAKATMNSLQSTMFSAWDSYKNLAESSTYENDDNTPKTENRTLPEFHIKEKNWLAAEAQYKNQQNVVAQAQAQVSSTWLLYQSTQNAVVKSPVSGKVSNLSVSTGSGVSVSSTLAPVTPVLSVGSFTETEVGISVGENDITKLKVGQPAEIEFDAVDDKTYKGIVKRVDSLGVDTKGIIKYNVYINVFDPDPVLLPGMSADVEITTQEISDILVVPNTAIKPYKGSKAVRIPGKKGEIEFIPVRVGIRGDKHTQIISGLKEGQTVITSLTDEDKKSSSPFGF